MAKYNYSVKKVEEENIAKAVGRALPISTKQSIEICAFIRKLPLEKAKKRLTDAINKTAAVPFKRFNDDMGHKKGKVAAGRYPEKACTEILKLLAAVEANAQFKGLNTSNLIISHICAHKAARPWHYGRQRRRKAKRTNVEIFVKEGAEKKKKETKKAEAPKKEDEKTKAEPQKKKPETKKTPAKKETKEDNQK